LVPEAAIPALEGVVPMPDDVMPVLEIIALQVPGDAAEGVEVVGVEVVGVEVPGVEAPGVVLLLGIPGVFSGAVLFPGVRGALFGESLLLGVTGVRLGAVLGLAGVDV
jgi:hypothetical protein